MRNTDVTHTGTGHSEEISGIRKCSHKNANWICKKEQANE